MWFFLACLGCPWPLCPDVAKAGLLAGCILFACSFNKLCPHVSHVVHLDSCIFIGFGLSFIVTAPIGVLNFRSKYSKLGGVIVSLLLNNSYGLIFFNSRMFCKLFTVIGFYIILLLLI